jgi:hypothetical protein
LIIGRQSRDRSAPWRDTRWVRSDPTRRVAKHWLWRVRSVIFIIVRLPVCVLIRAMKRR